MKILGIILVLSLIFCSGCFKVTENSSVSSGTTPEVKRYKVKDKLSTLMDKTSQKKICPVCGREFFSDLTHCPYDGAELETVE